MKVSILTVTQPSRAVFWPWLVKMVSRLELPPGEHEWLISMSAKDTPFTPFDVLRQMVDDDSREEWRLFVSDKKTLGERRQELLERATGDVIAWVDDDDWHHPQRITRQIELFQAVGQRASICTTLMAVELATGKGVDLRGLPHAMSFMGEREFALTSAFPAIDAGEDAQWFFGLDPNYIATGIDPADPYDVLYRAPLIATLVHGTNTTTSVQRHWRFHLSPEEVLAEMPAQYAFDQHEIEALRARLKLL